MVYKSLRKMALNYVSSNYENQDHQNNPSSLESELNVPLPCTDY